MMHGSWPGCSAGLGRPYSSIKSALAPPLIEESLKIFEQLGDLLQVDSHFIMLGWVSFERGDFVEARAYKQPGTDFCAGKAV